MSYEIKDKLSLKILFNNEEFLFGRANSLNFLHMVASTKIGVPMIHLSLQDNLDTLSESKHLADGARIQVVLAGRDGKNTTYVFRVNSSKRTPRSGGYLYEIDGYIDASTYWHASTPDAIKGTSYKALSQIASRCGLAFQGDQTADEQVWIPRNIRYNEWARQISERGYRSDNSCMQLGLNFDKTLTYRDITNARAVSGNFLFGEYRRDSILVTDIQPDNSAGSMNHFSGYSDELVEQDVNRAGVYRRNSSVQVQKGEGESSLLINSKIKSAVGQSKIAFAPIDVGNSHPEYEKALYQNRRINNLFSSKLSLVTPSSTNIKLLDRVQVTLDKTTAYLKMYSGEYIVGTRVIHVQSNEYFEKFELLRKSVGIGLQDAM